MKCNDVYTKIEKLWESFVDNHGKYLNKGNKSAGARARKSLGQIKKLVTEYRKLSVEDNIMSVLQFTGLSKKEQKIKLESLDYMDLIRDVENITNVGTDPDSKMFSIDIDNVKFIFTRD